MSGGLRDDPTRELGLTAAVCAGLLALATSGGADALAGGLLLPLAALAPWLRDRLTGVRWTLLLGLGSALVVAWAVYGSVHQAVSAGLVLLLLHQRLAPAADRWDRLVVLIVALLLLAASRREVGPAFLVAWAAWTASLPFALAPEGPPPPTSEVRARWGRSAAVLGLAAALFLGLPRRDAGPASEALVGLSDEVDLSSLRAVRADRTIVAEAWAPNGEAPPGRLRASALEAFDGRRWTRVAERGPSPPPPPGPGHPVRVEQAAVGGAVLLGGALLGWREAPTEVMPDEAGAWWSPAPGPFQHDAMVDEDGPFGPPVLDEEARARNTALPTGLRPEVAALAASATAGLRGEGERVAALVDLVASTSSYTLDVPDGGDDPVGAFLLDHHRGHCEHHAAAVAVLARTLGIPARVVVGVAGGEPQDDRQVFRALDAHAWTEVHLAGVGWLPVDATVPDASAVLPAPAVVEVAAGPMPAPPRAYATGLADRAWLVVTTWDGRDQRRAAPWAVGVGIAALGLGIALLWKRRKRAVRPAKPAPPRGGLGGLLDQTFEALIRHGYLVPSELPPLDAARWVAPDLADGGPALVELAWLYYEVAHGGAEEAPRVARGRELARQVLVAARR